MLNLFAGMFGHVMPPNNISNTVSTQFRQVSDNTFTFIIFVIAFIGLIASYLNPSKMAAMFNFAFLLVYGWFLGVQNYFINFLNTSFNANVLLPSTYTFITSTYYAVFILFFIIISIIFNMRENPKVKSDNDENN
jgi:hypothetical protein